MTEEIKEILDYLKRSDKNKFGFEQGKLIDYEEAQLLLDYITNLQQENEKEKQFIKDCGFQNQQQLVLAYLDYKSRCEKANKLLKTIYKALPGTYNQLLIEIDNYLQGSDENETNS